MKRTVIIVIRFSRRKRMFESKRLMRFRNLIFTTSATIDEKQRKDPSVLLNVG